MLNIHQTISIYLELSEVLSLVILFGHYNIIQNEVYYHHNVGPGT